MKKEGGLVYLTAEEMADVDRASIEDYGIGVFALMENAGKAAALVAKRMLGEKVAGRTICCLTGKGNNGGDGLVAARHLRNWGASVQVVLSGERSGLRDVPAKQAEAVEKMGVPFLGPEEDFGRAELLVDGLLGYGSSGNPRGRVADMIRQANASKIPILAVDIPSGMDATTGAVGDPCVIAAATVTFGFPKTGFLNPGSRALVGDLYLADISIPSRIYADRSFPKRFFETETIVKIW